MTSLILRVTSRFLLWGLVVASIWVLLRGHHSPGGGFIGALLASCGFGLRTFACGADEARRQLRVAPPTLIGWGLLVALVAGLPGALVGDELYHALWLPKLPLLDTLGTPTLFDVGVYLIVLGAVTGAIFSLSDVET